MVMNDVRLLDISHYRLINSFIKSKHKISHIPNEEFDWESWDRNLKNTLIDSDSNNVIGSFEDGSLKGLVIQSLGLRSPAWYMPIVVQENEKWLNNGHGQHINLCLQKAVDIAESKGVFEVIYNVPVKWLRTTIRTHSRSPIWSRYNVYVEEIVPAGREPHFVAYKYKYGQVRNHDVAIKKAVLKPEHRINYFSKLGHNFDTLT